MKPSEHVLHHVFGRLLIAEKQHREPYKTEPMLAIEGDQLSIRGCGRRGGHLRCRLPQPQDFAFHGL